MGLDQQVSGMINGSLIVQTQQGPGTGDVRYVTADGRQWVPLNNGVPNTLPTGAIISSIQYR